MKSGPIGNGKTGKDEEILGSSSFRSLKRELERPEEEDDDFLRDFELELDAEEAGRQMDEFPEEIFGKLQEKKETIPDEQLIENINGIVNEAKKRVEGIEPSAEAEESAEPENLTFEETSSLGEEEVPLMDTVGEDDGQIQDEAVLTAENGDASSADDLLEMLSGLSEDTDLSDIGAMLKATRMGKSLKMMKPAIWKCWKALRNWQEFPAKKRKRKKRKKWFLLEIPHGIIW